MKTVDEILEMVFDYGDSRQHESADKWSMKEIKEAIEEMHKAAYESKRCQCGYDDVCAFALEAEKLKAELARYTPVGYLEKHHLDGDRDIRLCNLTASPVWGDMVQIFIAKEKTE